MNLIRAKIILSWLLLVAFIVLVYSRNPLMAWGTYGIMLMVRQTKPKLPAAPRRIGYIISFGIIVYLTLVLIHGFYPFPPKIATTGKVLCALIGLCLFTHSVYSDFKAFRQPIVEAEPEPSSEQP